MIYAEETDYQCLINVTQCFNEIAPITSTEGSDIYFYCVICTICVFLMVLHHIRDRRKNDRKNIAVYERADPFIFGERASCPPAIKCNCRVDKPSTLTDDDLLRLVKEDKKYSNELPSTYKLGGYMPLELGTRIGPRDNYKVIKKLGHGSFATVWLCHSRRNNYYCAVKISKSAYGYTRAARTEFDILKYVKKADPEHPGYQNVVLTLGFFQTKSIYGTHICLAMELLGPSLANLLNVTGLRGFESTTVKNITQQLLMGIVYLHDICRIIHTDLKPENIIVVFNDSSYLTNMLKQVNRFNRRDIELPKSYVCSENFVVEEEQDSFEVEEVSNVTVYKSKETFPANKYYRTKSEEKKSISNINKPHQPAFINPNLRIKIADLGNGVKEGDNHSGLIQTREYRAIEVLIGDIFSFSADIWSVACIIFELLSGHLLFAPEQSAFYSYTEHHLSLITEVIGPIPLDVAFNGSKSYDLFQPDGQLRCHRRVALCENDLKKLFINFFNWDKEQANLLELFLLDLLHPDQNSRPTAAEALKNAWLNT